MTDAETLSVYEAKAEEYAGLVDADAQADRQLRRFLDHMPARATLWDVGCGPGRSAGLMAAEGHSVLATDASPAMVALAGQKPGVTARQESFDGISGVEVYDGIFANFSLLHAPEADLPRHIAALAGALKVGGLFHIGMKTGAGMKRDGLGRRYTYVTEDGLLEMLSQAGLAVQDVWTGSAPGLDGVDAPWVVMQAHKDG